MENYEKEMMIEKHLQSKLEYFKDVMKQAADTCITDLYVELLPHCWSDTDSNMQNRVEEAVVNIIAGKFEKVDGYAGGKVLQVNSGNGMHVRLPVWEYSAIIQPIFEAFKDEIKNERIKQLESEVEKLKRQLHSAYTLY